MKLLIIWKMNGSKVEKYTERFWWISQQAWDEGLKLKPMEHGRMGDDKRYISAEAEGQISENFIAVMKKNGYLVYQEVV